MSGLHWARLGETTFVAGTWLLYGVYRLGGRWPFRVLLYPVVLAYWLANPVARRASRDYLARAHAALGVFGRVPGAGTSLRHFALFAETLLDKMLAIGGRYPRERVRLTGGETLVEAVRAGRGGLIATAHLGCLELMQVAAEWHPGLRVTILVHTAHARRFNRILSRLSRDTGVRLMQVTDFTPGTAAQLAGRIAAGEFVAIAGDRVPVAGDRLARARFLGAPADLPAGPWLMAAALGCPVWGLVCLHAGTGYHADIRLLADRVVLPRGDRQAALDAHAAVFAGWLEGRLRASPLDWFNFYPFWDSAAHALRS